jgi:hypothetical protein
MKRISIVALMIVVMFITACQPGQIPGPTITPTFTLTSTPTITNTPTPTPSPTPTSTPSPTQVGGGSGRLIFTSQKREFIEAFPDLKGVIVI